ncbi:Ankyrin repeat domain-containing protein 29, partial [Ophiophagus hannah]
MGHSDVVRVMLLRGADRDAARLNGTSALHEAVLGGNIRAVALLLEAGADPILKNKVHTLHLLH